VSCANDQPTAADDNTTIFEDTPTPINVLDNDSDLDGDSLNVDSVTQGTHGSVTFNGSEVTYSPEADYCETDAFSYTVSDGNGGIDIGAVNVVINCVNDTPVTKDDTYITNEDVILNVISPGVLDNDTDVDGDQLTAVWISDPSHGTLTLNSDGSFTFVPDLNYYGSDSFTYQATDGITYSSLATVTITVNPVNDAPAADNDSFSTNEDNVLSVEAPGVLTNDTDVDGNALHAVLVDGPAHGSLTLNADGSFGYSPATNYIGGDSFNYKANDGTADSNVVTVTITVNPVNDAPVAVDDSYSTNEDTVLNVAAPGVLGSDTDADGDALHAVLVDGPAHGSLTLNADGSFSYSPATTYNGGDSFTYQANDGTADSNVATVTITVNPVNDAPVAEDDSYSTDEDTVLNVAAPGVLTSDIDVEGDTLHAVLVDSPAHGSLTLSADGSLSYSPATNYNGSDSFTYQANDGTADSDVATVTIMVIPVNDAPVAEDDHAGTDEDTPVTVMVLVNDTDVDNDVLSILLVTQGAHGSVAHTSSNLTYSPNVNFCGVDSFTYEISDGNGGTDSAPVSIVISCLNDQPTAADDSATIFEDTSTTIYVLENDTDLDGDGLIIDAVTQGGYGTVTNNLNDIAYSPGTNYCGTDTFTYAISDGNGGTDVASVDVIIDCVNDAPVANNDNYTTNGEITLSVTSPGVLGNDPDVDGDTLTAMLISDPSHGTLMLNADGSFTYIPDLNYSGSDSFTYEATDGIENSNLAIVIITVIQMNQPPTVDVGGPYTVQEGGEVTITAIGSDPENGTLIYTWDLDNDGDFDDMAGQSILFSAGNLDGPSTLFISVQVTDNSGLQYTDTAEIDVENVAPILSSILAPVDPYSIGTLINASATYSDPGVLDTHTATWNWGDYSTSAGVIDTSNISGSHIYNTAGVYTITLVVEDDDGGVASAIFQYIVIYDPDGGFVTGGGRITSPAGAYYPDPSLTGRATFGFVARYLKGAKTPTGSTEFQFHVANMNFRSTVYDWLVIAGTRAQFKGTGTINGIGEYAFIITVIDGSPDMFRIKIWDKLTGMIVYDNQLGAADSDDPTTAIDEGSIVIHKVR
jgi:VCBS repeat-containing protein